MKNADQCHSCFDKLGSERFYFLGLPICGKCKDKGEKTGKLNMRLTESDTPVVLKVDVR